MASMCSPLPCELLFFTLYSKTQLSCFTVHISLTYYFSDRKVQHIFMTIFVEFMQWITWNAFYVCVCVCVYNSWIIFEFLIKPFIALEKRQHERQHLAVMLMRWWTQIYLYQYVLRLHHKYEFIASFYFSVASWSMEWRSWVCIQGNDSNSLPCTSSWYSGSNQTIFSCTFKVQIFTWKKRDEVCWNLKRNWSTKFILVLQILRCGPPPMNKAMAAHLEALGYAPEMQFQF